MAQRQFSIECHTCERLKSALEVASRVFTFATAELARNLAILSAQDRQRLNGQAEQALADVANARMLLKMHQREHRC